MTRHINFEHSVGSIRELKIILARHGATKAILKMLPKNANDKNQVYFSNDFSVLYNSFALVFADRGPSTSLAKSLSRPGSYILEAVFKEFDWLRVDETRVRAKNVKAIIYTQYPEARLSGFQSIENSMPYTLSVNFTKSCPDSKRLLVLASLPGGGCLGMVCYPVSPELEQEVKALPGVEGSKVCKLMTVEQNYSERLFEQLGALVGQPHRGCRLDAYGSTLPFTGTQVCGYTLEHALGLASNSARDGDIYGIELKTHTQSKVTLFTPEPDFGEYVASFEQCMTTRGYEKAQGEWRITGIHRAWRRCANTGLTLQVREYRVNPATVGPGSKPDWIRGEEGQRTPFPYNPATSLTAKMDAVEVVLLTDDGAVVAGWSLARLMNNWGVKHNEVVYLSATRTESTDAGDLAAGFAYSVTFAPRVIWCRGTSAERLLAAINSGVIFLDPAPKFVANDPGKNKRRSQWRVNDVTKALYELYDSVIIRTLAPSGSPCRVAGVPAQSPLAPRQGPRQGHLLLTD